MKNENLNILDEINKGATMGMDAIFYISEKVNIGEIFEVTLIDKFKEGVLGRL